MRLTLAALLIILVAIPPAAQADLDPHLAPALRSADRNFRNCGDPPNPGLGARSLFEMALAYLEAGQFLDRLPRLFELAAQMQDRDPKSATYGNFRWYWRDDRVGDWNAVDFSMQAAALIWARHADKLTPEIRAQLQELTNLGIEGLIRHGVPVDYTNIVFMNAGNLIVLGELLGKPKAAEEGVARFEEALLYTCKHGTHEYDSPTYAAVDLTDVALMLQYSRNGTVKRQAEALLRYFWTDLAANWHPAMQRLCGSQARTYDYVGGLGYLDTHLMAAGWLPTPEGRGPDVLAYLTRWQPPAELRTMADTQLPRLVQQTWGPGPAEFKVHFLQPDVSLGTSGSAYGDLTDMPLTVDLPAERGQPRGYFIADGRNDPYGQVKFATGIHAKALHLRAFWAGSQRTSDAVGLIIYTDRTLIPEATVLHSNLVLPRQADGWWIGDQAVSFDGKTPVSLAVATGQPVVLRRATAAVGIKLLGGRDIAGGPAPASLVDDAGKAACVRLVVKHEVEGQPLNVAQSPMAALWVRVGSGLKDDAAFAAWRAQFAAAAGHAELSPTGASVRVAGVDGPVAVSTAPPWAQHTAFTPEPLKAILAVDGKDLGQAILDPVRPKEAGLDALPPVAVTPDKGAYWEAEMGLARPLMTVAEDKDASGGKFVWVPGEPGERGPAGRGTITWKLQVAKAGKYWLWGRVLTPTPTDDSFFVTLFNTRGELLPQTDWHTGTHTAWEWAQVTAGNPPQPLVLDLPAGDVFLHVKVREDGAKLDRLFLSADEQTQP